MSHIAPCYEYVDRTEGESSFDYGQRVANELEAEILRLGPETVMAFMAEPVVGATLGAVLERSTAISSASARSVINTACC